jgi:hypothetical protein
MDCWTDHHPYGSIEDMKCKSKCYDTCEEMLGHNSSICSCSIGYCYSGCLENCPQVTQNQYNCIRDCEAKQGSDSNCESLCDDCAVKKQCWMDTEYGGEKDRACLASCYTDCGDKFGENSRFCDCRWHGACVIGCPMNCLPESSNGVMVSSFMPGVQPGSVNFAMVQSCQTDCAKANNDAVFCADK